MPVSDSNDPSWTAIRWDSRRLLYETRGIKFEQTPKEAGTAPIPAHMARDLDGWPAFRPVWAAMSWTHPIRATTDTPWGTGTMTHIRRDHRGTGRTALAGRIRTPEERGRARGGALPPRGPRHPGRHDDHRRPEDVHEAVRGDDF